MEQKIKLVCCKTMMDEIEKMKPADMAVEYVEYALHQTPDKLREELQKRIDEEEEADTLVFVYGLCSNGLDGLRAGDKTLVIPRVHDCISLLLGSRDLYSRTFEENPGTYFLSKGWIDQEADPYQEYLRYVERYGEETARWVIGECYKNYTRVVFIDTGLPGMEEYEEHAKKVAAFLEAEYVRVEGDESYFEQLVAGSWQKNFLVIPPGGVSRYLDFM